MDGVRPCGGTHPAYGARDFIAIGFHRWHPDAHQFWHCDRGFLPDRQRRRAVPRHFRHDPVEGSAFRRGRDGHFTFRHLEHSPLR